MIGKNTFDGILGQGSQLLSNNGYLYNVYAATDVNIMPTDWEVPDGIDWSNLHTANDNGGRMKEIGFEHWDSPNTGATDEYGFKALGSGLRDGGVFYNLKTQAAFFSNYINIAQDESRFALLYNDSLSFSIDIARPLTHGASIRAIYKGTGSPTTVTDYDGNIYDVVLMPDGKYWTKQNWKCTRLNNGVLIPTVTDNTDWENATTPAKCAYNNDNSLV